ncbi:hypothetical protein HWV62_20248 [Athelia sp. TMB]|nr:hypothetical protein HWV62_20248 [Athelia sp. TMB]
MSVNVTKNPQAWKGYAIHDNKKYTDFKVIDFEPKTAGDYDVDIAIQYCGVCASDHHTISGGWGETVLPLITGHEITGIATKVGPKVTSIKVGDRVGAGAQICACFECKPCKTDNENYCANLVDTYNAKYPNGDIAHGGYSTGIRAHERFVFPIPDGVDLADAAPMLCGGLTTFSPLIRNGAGTTAKKVGIVGIGGLGHFAVMWAKALGCEVYAFSHSPSKKEDALKLGADHFVDTSNKSFAEPLAGEIDLIVSTASNVSHLPLAEYLSTLSVHGKLVYVGMPEDSLPPIKSQQLAGNGCFIGSSHIGNKKEAIQMLQLAADKGVKTWKSVIPMKDADKAIKAIEENTIRFRTVLKQDLVEY